MKVKIPVSVILLGALIPGSSNPYLSAPSWRISVAIEESEECRVHGVHDGLLTDKLTDFVKVLARGLELESCLKARLDSSPPPYRLGLYASITSALVYGVALSHGEKLDTAEVLEVSRLADTLDLEPSLLAALESLRYSSLENSLAVYRNEEEMSTLPSQSKVSVEIRRVVGAKPRISRDSLGSDVYGALIHLSGLAVLEAAVRLRDGASLAETLSSLKPIHDAAMLAVWGLAPSSDSCLWIPDLPGFLAEACIRVE